MTKKKKYNIYKKLEKIKQLVIIALMVISGLWYVTKGREKENVSYAFSEGKASIGESIDIRTDENIDNMTKVNPEEKTESMTENVGYADAIDRKSEGSESNGLINLNRATQKELETLPGVGPATAKNIIDYREKYGGFADTEEIKNVKRIGDKTYEKLKEFITV